MSDSLERNLTPQEVEAIERERRAALRALFEWIDGMRRNEGHGQMMLPGLQVWQQASFADLHGVDNKSDW